jgi:uncharacterized protein (TIGR02265 family)
MAANQNELAQRLSVVTPQDTIRGLGFRATLQLVRERLGQGAAEELRRERMERPPVDFFPYPASQFLELLYAAADLLEPVYGSSDAALRAMGETTTANFFASTVGKTLALMIGRDVHRLFSNASTAYGSVVNYGTRECTRLGDHKLRLSFTGDMQPVPYHEGMLGEGLRVVGARGTVHGTALGLTSAEYLVEWAA